MSPEQRASEYYRIAYECAEQQKKGCKGYCGNCPLNVSLYEPNTRDAVLTKITASMDNAHYHELKQKCDIEDLISTLVMSIPIILILTWIVTTCSAGPILP